MSDPVLVSAVRTPYGALMGALAGLDAPSLGGIAVQGALSRAGVEMGRVERVFLGNVSAHALGGNPAAAAWAQVGSRRSPACLTVRAGCASGLAAVALAVEAIASGSCEVALAGGFESCSSAPHLATGLRCGLRLGGGSLLDSARHDGPRAIPVGGEKEEDAFASARNNGLFAAEILAVELPARKKEPAGRLLQDEAIPAPPARAAGTALADGAAALLITSREWAGREKLDVLARLAVARPPFDRESRACRFVEADVTSEGEALLGAGAPAHPGLNTRGGAAQLGHAAGADGARLLVTLVHALRRESGGRGLAFAAGAWGEAAGVVAEV